MNTITLFSNRTILPGTHATLVSLLQSNKSKNKIHIILFADHLKPIDYKNINNTFDLHQKSNQSFEIREAPNMLIEKANSLRGNVTAYGRLFLADLLTKTNYVLYLDTDLIVKFDVNELFEKMNDEFTLFVDGGNIRNYSVDRLLFEKAGLDLDAKCFNSGVMGINLKRWRQGNGFQKCLDVINKYPNNFKSADQAVLNVAFANDFLALGTDINTSLYPTRNYEFDVEAGKKIFHFVGFPKPWDFLGNHLHKSYNLWKSYYALSAIGNENYTQYFNFKRSLKSCFLFVKSYFPEQKK